MAAETRPCPICLAELRPRDANAKGRPRIYCGDACRIRAFIGFAKERGAPELTTEQKQRQSLKAAAQYRARAKEDGRAVRPQYKSQAANCAQCRKPFRMFVCLPRKFCSTACATKATTKPLRDCEQCGAGFKPSHQSGKQGRSGHVQRYCSNACRAQATTLAAGFTQPIHAVPARVRLPRPCSSCGIEFTPKRRSDQILCSAKCKRAAGGSNNYTRAKFYDVPYEPLNKLHVFGRDSWRCQVCGVKTSRRLLGTKSDNAPELDHRIPMAMGGGHLWSNVQCCCRLCNMKKGGHTVRGQMTMFAGPHVP